MSEKCKQHPWHYQPGCNSCKAWSETVESSFAATAGSAYRMLKEGETIRESDEFLDDSGVWRKTICAGEPAPCPDYTAHRQYRRLKDTPNADFKGPTQ